MKILHTSDWHIGSTFYGKKRHDEYTAFFDWLYDAIQEHKADALLVAGDIFDTGLPSNTAQALYYSFLIRLRQSSCRHVIITGGNHDSPSFLNAPKELLKSLNIHVVGAVPDRTEDEIIRIEQNGEEVYVLAVPYLRERDLQGVSIADSHDNRARKIAEGIKKHYRNLTDLVLKKKTPNAKIIAAGHFFVTGASLEEEGERELYVGSLAQISAAVFPKELDYVALGHIHSAQKIGGFEHIRYSGSPLAMSFSERNSAKKILLLDTLNTQEKLCITEIPVPEFQIVRKIQGDFPKLETETEKLKKLGKPVWLEIEYKGEDLPDLKDRLFALTENSSIEILKFKNQNTYKTYLENAENDTLEDCTSEDVFETVLNSTEYSPEFKEELMDCYKEILSAMEERDINE